MYLVIIKTVLSFHFEMRGFVSIFNFENIEENVYKLKSN